jgi:hypothetical protein
MSRTTTPVSIGSELPLGPCDVTATWRHRHLGGSSAALAIKCPGAQSDGSAAVIPRMVLSLPSRNLCWPGLRNPCAGGGCWPRFGSLRVARGWPGWQLAHHGLSSSQSGCGINEVDVALTRLSVRH